MNDIQLKHIGSKVLAKAGIPEEEKFGSIIAILMIISIILTVIRVLQECNKNKLSGNFSAQDKYNLYGKEIKEYSMRRGWFTKMRIKKILRRELSKEQYEKYSLALVNALLETGENLNNEEISCLVEAANV
jgi:hypothetical protein